MSYSVIDQASVNRKWMEKTAKKSRWLHGKAFVEYFLSDCGDCLDFRFDDCCRKQTSQEQSLLNEPEVQAVISDDCYLDGYDEERGQHVYEFIIIPSFVAVVSYNSCKPVYIIKINEKAQEKRK